MTRATRNVVQQIDGRPAFDVYKEYVAKRGVSLTPANAGWHNTTAVVTAIPA